MGSNVEQKIGKYEVLSKIGEGGMGVVYKAKDPLIDRIVAIKMMTGAFAEEKESRERFLREARSVGKLQHPNIVTIYELGVEGNSPYMVMEFLEGKGLDRILSERVAVTLVQKLEYMEQICQALHYAHEHDIVHRDVKPANVIVMKGGSQVKLVDFGIARAGNSGMTKTGFAIGTTSYMSPEQIEASKGLDRRSDIFSAGVMMYEVLTNNLPFPGTEPIAIAIKILREPYPRLAAYLAEYPPELDDIMARALAKDRDERYSTAEEMAFDLSRLIDSQKREMVSQYVVEGRQSFEKKDLTRAKELLSYVLKIDPGNSEARQLNYEIQKLVQAQQKGEHLRQLKAAVEETIGQRQYDEALNFIEQALKIDPSNTELLKQKDLVIAEQQRRSEVKKRLNLAQSAEAMGDFRLAREHVEKALSLDPTDTHARMVKANIEQALAEQGKQKQIREYLDVAKAEMVEHRFTSAREAIKKAEALQPDSPEIQALKAAAYSAHEQELKRRELEQLAKDVQGMLAAGDPAAALKKANAALQLYPSDVTLLQLRATAEKQRAELTEREKTERLKKEHLQKAKDALNRKNFGAAIAELEGARIEFPADKEIADLLRLAREEEEAARVAAEKAAAAELAAAGAAAAAAAEAAARKKAAEERERAEERQRREAAAEKQRLEKQRREAEEERQRLEEKKRREAAVAAEKLRQQEKQRLEEQQRREAAAEKQRLEEQQRRAPGPPPISATSVFTAPSLGAAPAPAPSAYEETVVTPPPKKEAPEKPRKQERRQPVAPVVVPAPPSSGSGKWIGIGAAIAVVVLGVGSYFVFHKPATTIAPPTKEEHRPGEEQPKPPVVTPQPVVPEFGTLSLTAKDEKGAAVDGDIFVDNQFKEQIKRGKATIKLPVGPHQVRVQSANGISTDQTIEIAGDARAQLQFALKPSTGAQPKVTYLIITSIAGATVTVDDKAMPTVGADGKSSFEVQPGRHRVDVMLRGYKAFSQPVSPKEGERLAVMATLAAIPAPTVDFSATSTSIKEGDSTDLKWSSQGATEVTIDGGVGTVGTSGTKAVKPGSTTTYTLTAKGESAQPTTKTVTIAVAAAPKAPVIDSFAVSSTNITKGGSVKLTWATQNANDVSISGLGKVDPSGSRDITPSDTVTYRLTARGAGGSADPRSVTVTVQPAGPTDAEKAAARAKDEEDKRRAAEAQKQKDQAEIKDIIERQLKHAYETKNFAELQKVWPDMPKNVANDTKNLFGSGDIKSISMDFNCTYDVNADAATARCSQTMKYTTGGKQQSAPPITYSYKFKRTGGIWRLGAN